MSIIGGKEHPADVVHRVLAALNSIPGVRLSEGDGVPFALRMLRECYDHYKSQLPPVGSEVVIREGWEPSPDGDYARRPDLYPGARAEVMSHYFSRDSWTVMIRPLEQWYVLDWGPDKGQRIDIEPKKVFFFHAEDVVPA